MKKLSRFAILVLVLAVTAEFSPYLIGPIINGKSFSRSELLTKLEAFTDTISFNEVLKAEAGKATHDLHPYIGYVMADCCNSNKYGLYGPDPLDPELAGYYKVAIVGGSVAAGLYGHAHYKLEELIQESGIARDKPVTSFCLAVQGNKQPQQIMALSWMLSMGADFDLVINLDGFNEIVLPMTDNRAAAIHPTYPRNWQIYAKKGVNTDQLLATGYKISIAKDLNDLDGSMSRSMWRKSRIGLLFWDSRRSKLELELATAEAQLQASMKVESDRQLNGPDLAEMDEETYRRNSAEYWARCSELMYGLCKGNEIEYFHFLQPNQYVEDSKMFTEKELKSAYESGPYPYKLAVAKGYPMLGAEGEKLIANGIPFFDLTRIFASENQTIYADKCCHLNTAGSELMAGEIVKRMSGAIKNRPDRKK